MSTLDDFRDHAHASPSGAARRALDRGVNSGVPRCRTVAGRPCRRTPHACACSFGLTSPRRPEPRAREQRAAGPLRRTSRVALVRSTSSASRSATQPVPRRARRSRRARNRRSRRPGDRDRRADRSGVTSNAKQTGSTACESSSASARPRLAGRCPVGPCRRSPASRRRRGARRRTCAGPSSAARWRCARRDADPEAGVRLRPRLRVGGGSRRPRRESRRATTRSRRVPGSSPRRPRSRMRAKHDAVLVDLLVDRGARVPDLRVRPRARASAAARRARSPAGSSPRRGSGSRRRSRGRRPSSGCGTGSAGRS
jgi:hypothetical protein